MSKLELPKPEVPVITIERDDDVATKRSASSSIKCDEDACTECHSPTIGNMDWDELDSILAENTPTASTRKPAASRTRTWKWLKRALALLAVAACMAAVLVGFHYWNYYYNIGVPISVSPDQNIAKLQQSLSHESPAVVHTSDSILGVALDFYALHGLKATLEFQEPDTADLSVYLYCRSADYSADSTYRGSLVVYGEEWQSDNQRLGYMAMLGGNSVIGISRSEKVKDFVQERGGSFFRQFMLLSKNTIPRRFFLHGKVERRSIGRIGDQFYFIATRHKETLWDFADALREYGFIDAIYITGGDSRCYYRDDNAVRHDIGTSSDTIPDRWKDFVPWLVFRPLYVK